MSGVYLAPVSFGLGDLVVSLPVLQALIAQSRAAGTETWLVARSPAQAQLAERIAGLAGCVHDDEWDRNLRHDRIVDLRDHPLQRDHWWGSPEFEERFGPLSINDILGRISADFGIDADFSAPVPLAAHARPDVAASVLLVIGTDGPSKEWPAARWAAVAHGVRELGSEVGIVTRDDAAQEPRALGIEAICAPTVGDAVDVVSAARAVVGIDTGLTHLAAQQGTPTVMICRSPSVYFRAWPHTRLVAGGSCDDVCTAVEHEYAYNERVDLRGFEWRPRVCPVEGRCLDPVEPFHVLAALEGLL
jgi:hypothetical protein